jgi:amino acid transporter
MRSSGPVRQIQRTGGVPGLAREITPALLLLLIVGDILGGGIYALVGEVGERTGGGIWAAFLAALVMAAFTAGSYAELVSKYPHAGGAALYVHRAFRRPSVSFLVAFAVMASGVTSASALARGFGGDYLRPFVDLDPALGALALLTAIALLNFRGISESVRVNVGLTLVEVAGLVLIVIVAVVAVGEGDGEVSRALEFESGRGALGGILAGAALAFYAMIGFEDSVNVAEEAAEPVRTYPRVLFGGLALAGVLYLLVTIAAVTVVPVPELAGSSSPLLEVVEQGPLGIPPKVFSAIGLLALANGALINLIMASRLLYGMSREGIVPGPLGLVHPARRTPWVAIAFTTALAAMLALTGDLAALADTTVALLVVVFAIVNVTVLVLRRDPVEHRHFRVPWPAPLLGIGVSVALLTQIDAEVWLRAAALLALGGALAALNALVIRRRASDGDAAQPAADAAAAAARSSRSSPQ